VADPTGHAEARSLEQRVADELAQPASWAARTLGEAIVARHGDAVAALLFYGSCLRKSTHEGVLDFYLVVDSYRGAGLSRRHSCLAALLPPNVYYLAIETEQGTLRTKYAVISSRGFERRVRPSCLHPYIWARFAQPALLVHVRDAESRERITGAVRQAIVTLVQRLAVFMPAKGRLQRFRLASFWRDALRRTYSAELRGESAETIRSHYDADPDRYDEVAAGALEALEAEGWLTGVRVSGNAVEVEMRPLRRRLARLRWGLTRPLAKGLAVLRLLKTASTFGDWLPYALWKLERHSGVHIEVSERQRRHPLIFGWPVIFRIVARKELR